MKLNCPVERPSGLITSTVHVAAAVVKFGLITSWVDENELTERLGKVSPVLVSRSVTFAPLWKLLIESMYVPGKRVTRHTPT